MVKPPNHWICWGIIFINLYSLGWWMEGHTNIAGKLLLFTNPGSCSSCFSLSPLPGNIRIPEIPKNGLLIWNIAYWNWLVWDSILNLSTVLSKKTTQYQTYGMRFQWLIAISSMVLTFVSRFASAWVCILLITRSKETERNHNQWSGVGKCPILGILDITL